MYVRIILCLSSYGVQSLLGEEVIKKRSNNSNLRKERNSKIMFKFQDLEKIMKILISGLGSSGTKLRQYKLMNSSTERSIMPKDSIPVHI